MRGKRRASSPAAASPVEPNDTPRVAASTAWPARAALHSQPRVATRDARTPRTSACRGRPRESPPAGCARTDGLAVPAGTPLGLQVGTRSCAVSCELSGGGRAPVLEAGIGQSASDGHGLAERRADASFNGRRPVREISAVTVRSFWRRHMMRTRRSLFVFGALLAVGVLLAPQAALAQLQVTCTNDNIVQNLATMRQFDGSHVVTLGRTRRKCCAGGDVRGGRGTRTLTRRYYRRAGVGQSENVTGSGNVVDVDPGRYVAFGRAVVSCHGSWIRETAYGVQCAVSVNSDRTIGSRTGSRQLPPTAPGND